MAETKAAFPEADTQDDDGRSEPGQADSPHPPWRGVLISVLVGGTILLLGGAAFLGLASLKKPPAQRPAVTRTYNVAVLTVRRRDVPQIITADGTARAEREVVLSARVSGRLIQQTTSPLFRQVGGVALFLGPQWGLRETLRVLKVGQPVSPDGPLIAQVDPTIYRLRYEQARLKIEADEKEMALLQQQQANNEKLIRQAELDLLTYREEYNRLKLARQRGAAVASQLTEAKLKLQNYTTLLTRVKNENALFPLQWKQLLNRRKQHEKERDLARYDLHNTQIAAEFPGIISEVFVQPGEFVKVDEPVVRILDNRVVEIPLSLSPEDYAALAPLVRRATSRDALPRVQLAEDEEQPYQWEGRVVRLSPRADELTRTARVYVEVDNRAVHRSGRWVLPGQHYHARIAGPPLRNVLAVPREALLWKNGKARQEESRSFDVARVFVATQLKRTTGQTEGPDNQAQPMWEGVSRSRTVRLLRTAGPLAVIETGLQPGDRLILTNLDVLHDGARVRFAASETAAP